MVYYNLRTPGTPSSSAPPPDTSYNSSTASAPLSSPPSPVVSSSLPVPPEELVPAAAPASAPAMLVGLPAAVAKPGALAEDAGASSSPRWIGGFGFFGGRKEKEEGGGAKAEILESFDLPNPPPMPTFDYKLAKGGTLELGVPVP